MSKKNTYVVANWKMNPGTLPEAKKLFGSTKKAASGARGVTLIVCPPAVFISELKKSYSGKKITFGAQDIFWEPKGPYTGQLSGTQVASVGASYVILGHSELRERGETHEMVRREIECALKAGLAVILCIGETARDHHGEYLDVLRQQLRTALSGFTRKMLADVMLAYEPVWAIGAGTAMDPHHIHETVLYLRKLLSEGFDKNLGLSMPMLYGGSVSPENAEVILREGRADGFLVGGASLDPEKFTAIVEIASAYK